MRTWTNEEIKRYLGPHEACYLSHSSDPDVRRTAASGGSISQLAIGLLEGGHVDGVLVWRMVYGEARPRTEAFVATSREEILDARGSKYCAVDFPRDALPKIEAFAGRLAVLTLPCDASFLRHRMEKDESLREKVRCVLTLFCGHNSEPALTELVTRRLGVSWPEVRELRYRTGPWRGALSVRTSGGRARQCPTPRFTHWQNLHFYSQRKCLSCVDHYGFDGDICAGDSWALDAKERDLKPTMLVARTPRGAELLAVASRGLEMQPVEARAVLGGNGRGLAYHYNISARSRVARRFGLIVKDKLRLPTTPLDRLIATLGVGNYWLSHHPRFERWVRCLPHGLLVAYVFLFKGLQQLGLALHRPFPPADRISLIGATLSGNRGAEAMLVTSIARMRMAMPDDRYVVHSYFPKRDRELCGDLNVDVVDATPLALVTSYLPFSLLDAALRLVGLRWPRSWMPRGVRELARSKALVDVSGISFSDGREQLLPFNVLNQWPANLLQVPVVRLSQGLGPFRGRINARVARWMLRRCVRVFARGEDSLAACRALGLGERLGLAADIAFSFEESHALTRENPEHEQKIASELGALRCERGAVLALSLSAVVHRKCEEEGRDHAALMAQVIERLAERGVGVLLLPNATREDTPSLHNNDLPVLREVVSALTEKARKAVVAVDRDLNSAALRRLLASCDALVASRFHAMIAGLALGLPTLVVGWGHKYREVLAQFGLAEQAWDYRDLDAEALLTRIGVLLDEREALSASIEAALPRVQALSEHQFAWLRELLSPDVRSAWIEEAE